MQCEFYDILATARLSKAQASTKSESKTSRPNLVSDIHPSESVIKSHLFQIKKRRQKPAAVCGGVKTFVNKT